MILAVVLIPGRDDEGRKVRSSDWRELQDRLRAFGGFSRRFGVRVASK